ncbi:MAG: hypothetical protein QF767_11685, partial [Alphaproteobacteria bacterium]|nr:hypothetical protein [Alphaproteobacteria bacterium]
MSERILILDFGSQVTQLIARRLREANVYCEIMPFDKGDAAVRDFAPKGIILSGGPASVTLAGTPRAPQAVFDLGVPQNAPWRTSGAPREWRSPGRFCCVGRPEEFSLARRRSLCSAGRRRSTAAPPLGVVVGWVSQSSARRRHRPGRAWESLGEPGRAWESLG